GTKYRAPSQLRDVLQVAPLALRIGAEGTRGTQRAGCFLDGASLLDDGFFPEDFSLDLIRSRCYV
ncbi:MAG: hypothetical protein KAJ05_08480, partial [Candidatus Latescibacteria bacterium]|nr:hypothetical protein [Candidatus Latescibacterota bacterium]